LVLIHFKKIPLNPKALQEQTPIKYVLLEKNIIEIEFDGTPSKVELEKIAEKIGGWIVIEDVKEEDRRKRPEIKIEEVEVRKHGKDRRN